MRHWDKIKRLFMKGQAANHFDSRLYWEQRYREGGNSGSGSYGILAEYKAGVINDLIKQETICSAVEFGCGDGNQLGLIDYPPCFVGLDVSPTAIERCQQACAGDASKHFLVYRPAITRLDFTADLVLCLDVLYHIVEDEAYYQTLHDIFSVARRWVCLYTNTRMDLNPANNHIKWRDTLGDLQKFPSFELIRVLNNPHSQLSSANFILIRRKTC